MVSLNIFNRQYIVQETPFYYDFFIGRVDARANVAFLSHSNFLSVTGKIILQVYVVIKPDSDAIAQISSQEIFMLNVS